MNPLASTRAEKLRQLRDNFVRQIPGMLDTLTAACRSEAWTEAHRHAHTLAGTAGTFGLEEVGVEARSLELLLQDVPATGGAPDPLVLGERIARLQAAVTRVRPPAQA